MAQNGEALRADTRLINTILQREREPRPVPGIFYKRTVTTSSLPSNRLHLGAFVVARDSKLKTFRQITIKEKLVWGRGTLLDV